MFAAPAEQTTEPIDMEAYTAAAAALPFDDFDDAYYALYENDPLDEYVATFIRDHADSFAAR